MQKGFFGVCFFCFLVVLFFVACVFVLVFCKKAQKGYFPAILEVFCLFCSPKRPVLKCFFSSFSVFFPGFPFFFPFKIPFFLCFLSINPFLEKILCGGFFCHFILSFPFLMFASFFETNFLTSPFWNPSCFCFWHFFCCFCFCFHGVCFCLSVLMLALFCYVFILFWFCFCFVSCFFLLSDYEKNTVFPAILVFLSCWL